MVSAVFLDQARALLPELIQIRRTLHQWPELAFEEHRTAALVARQLHGLRIAHETEVARTGVVGVIGRNGGPVIAHHRDHRQIADRLRHEHHQSHDDQRPH